MLLSGRRMSCHAVVLCLASVWTSGCSTTPPDRTATNPPDRTATNPPDTTAAYDVGAIAVVVEDVYRNHGAQRMIFLGSDDENMDGVMLERARSVIADKLRVKVSPEQDADRSNPDLPVLTPFDPETGEIGISISLGRFEVDGEGRWHVLASYARSGIDGAGLTYTLERDGSDWVIVAVEVAFVS